MTASMPWQFVTTGFAVEWFYSGLDRWPPVVVRVVAAGGVGRESPVDRSSHAPEVNRTQSLDEYQRRRPIGHTRWRWFISRSRTGTVMVPSADSESIDAQTVRRVVSQGELVTIDRPDGATPLGPAVWRVIAENAKVVIRTHIQATPLLSRPSIHPRHPDTFLAAHSQGTVEG